MASAAALRLAPASLPLLSSLHQNLRPRLISSSPLPSRSHPLLSRPLRCCSSSSPVAAAPTPPPILQVPEDPYLPSVSIEDEGALETELDTDDAVEAALPLPSYPSPELTIKEKKELASYAHSLGKKLKSQQVGKSGVTPSVAASFLENLESNELLKIKVHGNCPRELSDVIKQLEGSTGSVAVSQIGRSVILYRPSLSKMKKREAQSARKVWSRKPPGSLTPFKSEKYESTRKGWNTRVSESPTTFKWQRKGGVRHGQQQARSG